MNHWVAGYVDWNMVLDVQGKPRWNKPNGTNANAGITVDAVKQEYYKEPLFYGLGHFSKFIVPDSIKIGLTEDRHLTNVFSTAFERPDGAVVVVVFNGNDKSIEININEDKQEISHTIKAHSIQTYIYY